MSSAPEVEAWRRFCRRMEALGERILADDFPNSPTDVTEGIAHLADQVSCWLGWSLAHADTSAPFFHRSNDLFTQWGGPNQDNAYHHARIDPRHRYRIRGRMHGCEHFVLTLRVGFMHMKAWGTKAAISSADLGVGPGDDFEILLGGDDSEPGWTPIPQDVTTVSLREYYVDWQPSEPAVFTIECLDPTPAAPGPEPGTVAARLDHALDQVESSMLGWNEYLREHRARGTDNAFASPETVAKGLSDARYAFLFWDLAPDEALLIETDVPRARYWGLQLATLGWFEPVDPVHRITSINQHQARPGRDGQLRFVLAHRDPAVPNWLDTAGHRNGLLTYRWFWPESDPSPTARVLPLRQLGDALPADTPEVDAAERRADIAARKAHLAWRFRT
ncbi:MAG: hypothetical protein QNK04_06310 [Myxococcota bacterium]|nr:hypothetical protein [Myxococcota bacterium]